MLIRQALSPLAPRALREAPRRVPAGAAGPARAVGREGTRGRHRAQLALRARRGPDHRASRRRSDRRAPARALGDPPQQAGRDRGRGRQLAHRPGAVRRRNSRRPRLARPLRRVGLDGRGAADRRGVARDAQVPRVAGRRHGRPLSRLPRGVGRNPADLGGPGAGEPRRDHRVRKASCGSTAAASRSSRPTGSSARTSGACPRSPRDPITRTGSPA